MSSLTDLIHSKNYDAVVVRAHAYPNEAIQKSEALIRNNHGNTPLDVAMKCASDEVIQFLQNPQEEQEERRLLSDLFSLRQEMHVLQNENANLFRQYHNLTLTHNSNAASIASLQKELDATGHCIVDDDRRSSVSEMTFDTFDLRSIGSVLSFTRDMDDDDDDTSKKEKTKNKGGFKFFLKNHLSLTRNSRLKSSGRC